MEPTQEKPKVLAVCMSPETYADVTALAKAERMTRKAYVERAIKVYRAFAECFGTKCEKPKLEVRA